MRAKGHGPSYNKADGELNHEAARGAEADRWRLLRPALWLLSAALYALHFAHLTADFPHDSPWNDWAKYTDEGWYGDGAIRHFVLGHWFLPGDFNPAVAMPVWPLLEAVLFRFTGVSLVAARALAVAVFGVMLLALDTLLRRHAEEQGVAGRRLTVLPTTSLAAPLAVLFACASPFFFAFDRLAVLEPLVAALAVMLLLLLSYLQPAQPLQSLQSASPSPGPRRRVLVWPPQIAIAAVAGVLLAALLLTKPTAVALLPAIVFYLWRRAEGNWRALVRMAGIPLGLGAALPAAYYALLVRPHFKADFDYLFAANAYTGFQLEPLSTVLVNTVSFGHFMGGVLYGLFFVLMAGLALLRPRFFRNALVPTLLVWMGGYLLLLGYHNNLQPRYYLPLAVPVTALVALGLDEVLRWAISSRRRLPRRTGALAVAVCVAAIVVPDAWQEIGYALHPDFSYVNAARQIAAQVRADRSQSPVILSVSGSELTLMTGLPSIDDDFGTLDLEERVRLYRPGWFVAWNELDDDKMDALGGLYQPVRVASFPAMDDPDRNLLILYRLDPASEASATPPRR